MSADPPIPIDPDFRILLPNFEGPLDLLLYLIQKHELDVLDLPVAFVTERYVEYLALMQRLNLDVAAEYLLMAATLAHIKSKSLLPPDPQADAAEQAEEEAQDPRAELIRRLLEYQKYKKVAEDLGARGVAGRDVFPRGSAALGSMGPAPLAEFSVFRLLDAFRKIAGTVKGGLSLEVTAERITIQDRIQEITTLLAARRSIRFEQLFEGATTTYELVVSFLALLEMAKMRMIRVYQADPEGPIHLEYRLLSEHDTGEDGPSIPDALRLEEEAVDTSSSPAEPASPLDSPAESGQDPEPEAEPEDEPSP
jgi:segregation and condensation protein A